MPAILLLIQTDDIKDLPGVIREVIDNDICDRIEKEGLATKAYPPEEGVTPKKVKGSYDFVVLSPDFKSIESLSESSEWKNIRLSIYEKA